MPWFKVDDSFHAHPKVTRIPRRERTAVIGLWCLAGSWCADQLTDGHLGAHMVEEFGSTKKTAERLVEVGLWVRTDDGYAFHEWTEWQPTREAVTAKREAEAQRKADYRARRAAEREAARTKSGDVPTGVPDVSQRDTASPSRHGDDVSRLSRPEPDPTRPDPTATPTELQEGGVGGGDGKPSRRKPETPLPDDWQPTPEHRAYAEERGLDLDVEADAFRDHAETHDRRARSWNAAFRTWLKRAQPRTQLRAVPDTQPDVPWIERARALMPILQRGTITREDLDAYEREHGTVQVNLR